MFFPVSRVADRRATARTTNFVEPCSIQQKKLFIICLPILWSYFSQLVMDHCAWLLRWFCSPPMIQLAQMPYHGPWLTALMAPNIWGAKSAWRDDETSWVKASIESMKVILKYKTIWHQNSQGCETFYWFKFMAMFISKFIAQQAFECQRRAGGVFSLWSWNKDRRWNSFTRDRSWWGLLQTSRQDLWQPIKQSCM